MPGAALDLVFGNIERPKFCAGECYRLVKERDCIGRASIYGGLLSEGY
jgi:hypothetical protein